MNELHTEVEIAAPAEKVWQILTDFAKYPEWNPFITKISGDPKNGARLEVHINAPNDKERVYKPTVENVEKNKELRWLGKSFAGLFSGEHSFTIEPINEKHVRFNQDEKFSGLLTAFMGKRVDTKIRQGFEQMNNALKTRAER